ncbi:DEAD/DEAH box helicase [Bdellovibrio bacteriovorus]|uniref:Putative ATP-dependent RNA helicase n=1 Tax=Bdellovibrio bacteriovorus (strain ATCC 15356 / DSM 50701 / NCIMB 9529 / HD100) TaxID=264462 RepID=Q6MQX8_BDEBA|nr:DEAD/DEAH box helicase [Bdellovibrio bacteriovorus]CAE77980.1 putative ATP-dependent RNA helicase [Bdellovibrio bacteriovorus HD100]
MKFEKFHLSEDLLRNLTDNGFFRTTDIQYKAIPSILKGEDVLAIAQTGTGKTAAFAIPIINMIHTEKSSKRAIGIKCLILVPTRELAQQIGEVFNKLSKHTKVKPFALFGGVEQDAQIQKLQDGIDILISTPGRMFDLIAQGHVDISRIETLVLDEADHMLDLGFIDDITSVKRKLTKRHQTLFFSATINPEIKKLAFSQVRSSAIRIQISPEDPVSKNITHFVMHVEMDDKRFFLAEYLRQNPDGKFIIFVRTRVRAERVAKALARVEVQSLTLHGEKDQTDRAEVMKTFRKGDCKILIATDLSARGIDIPDVTHVINYDLPEKPENYVHRIGRTGRGFNKGVAVSFCSTEEKPLLAEVESLITKKIEVLKVSKQDYKAIVETQDLSLDASLQELLNSEDNYKKASKRKKK